MIVASALHFAARASSWRSVFPWGKEESISMMSMAVTVKRLWLMQRLGSVYLMLVVIVVCDSSLSEDFVLDNSGLSEQVPVNHSVVVIAPIVSIG